MSWALVYLQYEFSLRINPSLFFKSFLQGLVRKRYTSNVFDRINSNGSLIKLDTMSYLIKEGYFNLSTMLNLKSLWMPHMQKHPNQSIQK